MFGKKKSPKVIELQILSTKKVEIPEGAEDHFLENWQHNGLYDHSGNPVFEPVKKVAKNRVVLRQE